MQGFLDALVAPGHIAVLDLNAMKMVNDVHGYTVGDAVIVTVANRLRARVGDRGTVFRFGGNEYVVLLPALDAEQSERLLVELLAAVAKPIAFGSESVTISATGGLAAVAPSDPLRDLGQANGALRHAKRQGVSYTIFKPTGDLRSQP